MIATGIAGSWHHQRDPRARSLALSPAPPEGSRQTAATAIEIAVADGFAHADIGCPLGKLADTLCQKIGQRRELAEIDFGRHAG